MTRPKAAAIHSPQNGLVKYNLIPVKIINDLIPRLLKAPACNHIIALGLESFMHGALAFGGLVFADLQLDIHSVEAEAGNRQEDVRDIRFDALLGQINSLGFLRAPIRNSVHQM